MPVSASWVNPSAGGTLDLSAGAVVTEAVWDGVISDLLVLGGVAGIVTVVQAAASLSGTSTTSASFVNIASMTLTTTTTATGGGVLALFTASCQNSSNTTNDFGLAIDGTNQGPIARFNSVSVNSDYNVHFQWTAAPSAASHTFTIQWRTGAGTLAVDSASYAHFALIEFRR